MGLLSDGGVHSHIRHLFSLIDMARIIGVPQVFIHPIMDGRDTSPTSGITYMQQLSDHLDKHSYRLHRQCCRTILGHGPGYPVGPG